MAFGIFFFGMGRYGEYREFSLGRAGTGVRGIFLFRAGRLVEYGAHRTYRTVQQNLFGVNNCRPFSVY
jgi:hypothetical protein